MISPDRMREMAEEERENNKMLKARDSKDYETMLMDYIERLAKGEIDV